MKASPAKGQATEVHATQRRTDRRRRRARPTRCRRRAHTFEFLRTIAHLRPRTNTFGAIARVRHQVSIVDPRLLPGARLPLRPHADHHRQRLRRGGRTVPRHARIDPDKPPKAEGKTDYTQDFFGKPAYLTVSGQLQVESVRLLAGQGLHLRPDVPGRELEHPAAPRRVLDDRTGDGVLRPERQHGPGRGVPQADHRRRAGSTAPRIWSSSTSGSTRSCSRGSRTC